MLIVNEYAYLKFSELQLQQNCISLEYSKYTYLV
jgi:hypothetical protein